jgi:hypothetical protein
MSTSGSYTPFYDSFDNGLVNFPDSWNADLSVLGEVTLHRPEYYLTSGIMEATGTAGMGHGYGTYTVHAKLDGNYPGQAIMLWNSANEWPGSEIDITETVRDGSGDQYAALHWVDVFDRFEVQLYDPDIANGVFHEYQAVWEPGRITINVDGVTQAVFTGIVPKDFEHGGTNHVFAFLNTMPETSLTVRDVSYVPLGMDTPVSSGGSVGTTPVVSAPPPSNTAATPDWDGLAAAVQAAYDATGQWYIPEGWNADGTRSASAGTTLPPVPPADPVIMPPSEPTSAPTTSVVDWDGLAAAVQAAYEATGQWYIPEGWNADGTRSGTSTAMSDAVFA